MLMAENDLINPRLKSIAEFLDGNHHFFIPYYQRGYRWEERQILDLLKDILEFQDEIKKKPGDKTGEFYCLQPIVVLKREDNKWEVIDGQQRLTTIFILLSSLIKQIELLKLPSALFTLEYETREKEDCSSREFLKKITTVSVIDKTNIDFFRMSDAFLIIKKWLDNDKLNLGVFCNTLLNTDFDNGFDRANNVRFIWYELNPGDDKPEIAFGKFNQGKIDLTNAELIKAIFYLSDISTNNGHKEKYQVKIGYEWDDMENTLRKKDFWKFINPNKEYTNHLEFIIELIAEKYRDKINIKVNKKIDALWSYHVFNELITGDIDIYDKHKYTDCREFLWDEVKTYYRTFVEWYNDSTYYHIIGFLLHVKIKDIEEIKKLVERCTKKDLKEELRELIQKHFEELDLEQIGFDYNKDKARELLLLFNVVTTMNSRYNRFAFDRFADENWSLEHIHAQQSDELKRDKQKRLLLNEQKNYFSIHNREDLLSKINWLLDMKNIDQNEFNAVQNEIFEQYSKTNNINSIKNLALLRVPDNSCLNKNIFPIKRDRIKNLDEQGSFIPICTKNVFLKYYSRGVEQNVKWDIMDMNSYLEEIKKVLKNYITVKNNEH